MYLTILHTVYLQRERESTRLHAIQGNTSVLVAKLFAFVAESPVRAGGVYELQQLVFECESQIKLMQTCSLVF